MSEHFLECVNCGKPLPAPDAVCLHCANEFASPGDCTSDGKYLCPICNARFNVSVPGWYPPDVPWYRPQEQKARCPHCLSFLRDQSIIPIFSTFEYAIFVGLVLAANHLPWRPWVQILLLIFIILLLVLRWKRGRSFKFAEENRYVVEPPRH